MGASAADYGIIAIFQATDEAVAAGRFGNRLHLSVTGTGFAHADIFPHGLVKQVVVLGDKGHLAVKLGKGDFFQILSSQGDLAFVHIPESADELGDGALAGTGGPHKGGHTACRDGKGYVVEDLLVVVVTEGNVLHLNIHGVQLYHFIAVVLLFTVQNGVHFAYNGAHLCQAVHKIHGRQQWAGDP